MPLGTFLSGAYTTTLNSVAIGITEGGFEVQYEPKQTLINRSDQFGDTLIETIYRGGDWFCQCDALEYKTGPKNAITQLATLGQLGVIGRLGSDIAQALVMTVTAGTPAAVAADPTSLTATKALLAPNANPRLLFNSELRKVPIRWVFLPYDSSGIKFFTTT